MRLDGCNLNLITHFFKKGKKCSCKTGEDENGICLDCGAKHEKFQCDDCDKTYKSNVLLLQHKKFHIKIACKLCKKLISEKLVKLHMEAVHGDKEKQAYSCNQCSFTSHAKTYLNAHISNSHGSQLDKKTKNISEAEENGVSLSSEDESGICCHCGEVSIILECSIFF